jgi:uncharacterized protein (DUF1810 family)
VRGFARAPGRRLSHLVRPHEACCARLIAMNTPSDPLERFVRAQERDYAQALAELTSGRKQTHWIWYVLPQLRGLGRSEIARKYGITGREEAARYFAHPLLGERLVECVNAILRHHDRSAIEVLGNIDAMKFRSCLTLFAEVAPSELAFSQALATFYQSKPDLETLRHLRSAAT